MVKLVPNSPIGGARYREQNRQLARELNEHKEKINQQRQDLQRLVEELHRCKMELQRYKDICNAIECKSVEYIDSPEYEQSIILPITQGSYVEEDDQAQEGTLVYTGLDAIAEQEDEEEEEAEPEQTVAEEEEFRVNHEADSLEPADVTSVPSLHPSGPAPEQATLSIYKCLDDTNTPNSDKDKSMFHSTPKRPVLADNARRVSMSPMIRTLEQEETIRTPLRTRIDVQQQSHAEKELEVNEEENEVKEVENEVREVKKSKRKATKQKEEDAKRPRTYNTRKAIKQEDEEAKRPTRTYNLRKRN